MPLRAGIEQADGARGAFSGDRDARDLIADLDRQVELHRSFALAWAEGKGRLAERLAAAGQRLDDAGARPFGAAQDTGGKCAALARTLSERERGVVAFRPEHGKAAAACELGKSAGESLAAAVVETVGEPQHAEAGLAAELLFERRGKRGAIGGVRLGTDAADAFARLIRAQGRAHRLAWRGGRKHDGAAVAGGAVDRRFDRLAALGPMRGGGPAIIDDDEEGTCARETLPVGIEHRARERKDDQRGE